MQIELFAKELIVAMISVCRITHNRMRVVLQMPPNLMSPTGLWFETQQRIASGWISPDCKWDFAPTKVVQPVVPEVPINSQSAGDNSQALVESIERGRKLFFSAETKCASCHGDGALGDGETTNFDDWSKAVFQPDANMKINADHAAEMLALGALPVRNIRPRNLRQGIYRGGRRPIDLYRRIFSGINGTPMPAQGSEAGMAGDEVADDEAGGSVRRQQIWDLVNYVLSLPYEPLSQPPRPVEGYETTLR